MTWYFQSPHALPPALDLLFPSCTKPASLGQPQTTSNNLEKPQTILKNLKQSWQTSNNLGKPQRILDNLKESWTTSDSFEQLRTTLDNLGKSHSFAQHLGGSQKTSDNACQPRKPLANKKQHQELALHKNL